jgi:uncharacterized protein (DUF849 family)
LTVAAFIDRGFRGSYQNVKPEIEVFDPGMIYNAAYYLKKGVLRAPLHFRFCMGVPGGIKASVKNLVFMRDTMDGVAPGSTFGAFGIARICMEGEPMAWA